MGFRVVRTPGMTRRQARNFDRLTNKNTVTDPDGAIQEVGGAIVLIIATGEPFTQSSAGLVLALAAAGGLEKSSSELQIKLDPAGEDLLVLSSAGLNVDEGELYSFVSYYGS